MAFQLQQAQGLKRAGGAGLSEAAVSQIFGAPVGAAGVALADKGGRYVFKVTDATTPPLDVKSPEMAAFLPQSRRRDVRGHVQPIYRGLAERNSATKVNQTVLRSALGSEQ